MMLARDALRESTTRTLLVGLLLSCTATAPTGDRPAEVPAPPVLPAASPAVEVPEAPTRASTVLFVSGKDGALVPVACHLGDALESDPERCLAGVAVGDEVASEGLLNAPGGQTATVLGRVVARTCEPAPALTVAVPATRWGRFQIWPAARSGAIRPLADHAPSDAERAQVLALIPAEARRIAVENASRYDPITAGRVDLDGDGRDEQLYSIDVASTFDAQEEGLPGGFVFDALAVRWSATGELALSLTFDGSIRIDRVTDLDHDGRAELLFMDAGRYQLIVSEGRTLRRLGTPRCVF
ncbi:hypothetical protein SAMN02745121_02837 [Nannocystis exedens]|uniref:Uncharacterized protein n=1 Tax=Nannocystis exedens TaxID=54 RepID=A0A1I1XKP4_9BACT|nr:hypothetical protein [Nannocystis exedens]PCC73434.1 hypothetical protein NAEX_06522 [Nannocystis exedens]SFE06313.1 hypothetical protein SAMN02745121_02837 [Nannocystis exedens]